MVGQQPSWAEDDAGGARWGMLAGVRWPVLLCATWLVLASCVLLGSPAHAQRGGEPSPDDLDEARAFFAAGESAVEAGRWSDAVDDYRRAYELSGVPAALYNVGFALRALGRYREARDVLTRLLDGHPELAPELREEARGHRDEAAARVAILRLVGLYPHARHAVRLDGREVADEGSRPLEIEADPGPHAITVRAEGHEPFAWEGELAEGDRRSIHVELRPTPSEPSGILASPLFWIVVGTVAVGGAAIAGYVLHQGAQLEPQSDRVYEL